MTVSVSILDARVDFIEQPLPHPLIISSGAITCLTEAQVVVRCQANDRIADGRGSIYLSDLWAWPDPALSHGERDAALRQLCTTIASNLPALCGDEAAHPLELGLRLHHAVCRPGVPTEAGKGSSATMPALARAMCLSPFDAALHDAAGLACGRSAFDLYVDDMSIPSAAPWLGPARACGAIRSTLTPAVRALPAWLLVGKQDDLERDMRPWVTERHYRCFKIKIMGQDNATDVARTIEVFHAARQFGATEPWLSVDSNEANPSADSVLDYLTRLRAKDSEAFAALRYLEQPTGRDILAACHDWRAVTRLKPVFLDEGLTSLDLMEEARRQGWSGFALKTCKGHSFALVAAAWARQHGMQLTVQDLTNPGYALIHAALLAAHLPSFNGVELNSPQFTPAANSEWLPRHNRLFEPHDGLHHLPNVIPQGLGSTLAT